MTRSLIPSPHQWAMSQVRTQTHIAHFTTMYSSAIHCINHSNSPIPHPYIETNIHTPKHKNIPLNILFLSLSVGEQARKFFLQSGLPASVLAEIW